MKQYQKEIDGKLVRKQRNEIVLHGTRTIKTKDGKEKEVKTQIINPKEEQLLADGWIEYVTPTIELTDAQLYRRAMAKKLLDLENYDSSSNVNDCLIVYQGQEFHYWANKTERDTLKGAVKDCMTVGRDTYRLDLRDKNISIIINCDQLLQMLTALEVYAIDCYNKTTDHKFAIKSLSTLEEVESYDFKVGYPEKLIFYI